MQIPGVIAAGGVPDVGGALADGRKAMVLSRLRGAVLELLAGEAEPLGVDQRRPDLPLFIGTIDLETAAHQGPMVRAPSGRDGAADGCPVPINITASEP